MILVVDGCTCGQAHLNPVYGHRHKNAAVPNEVLQGRPLQCDRFKDAVETKQRLLAALDHSSARSVQLEVLMTCDYVITHDPHVLLQRLVGNAPVTTWAQASRQMQLYTVLLIYCIHTVVYIPREFGATRLTCTVFHTATMPCLITNGARSYALEMGMDVEILASRHTGAFLSVEDVTKAARNLMRTTRKETVLTSSTVATWPTTTTLPGFRPGVEISAPRQSFRDASGKRFRQYGAGVHRAGKGPNRRAEQSRAEGPTNPNINRECSILPKDLSVDASVKPVEHPSGMAADRGPELQQVVDSAPSLQERIDNALHDDKAAACLNTLATDLAIAGETAALVCIWDRMGGAECATPATWCSIEALHARSKGQTRASKGSPGKGSHVALRLTATSTRSLAPERRLHKICKGRVTHSRSEAALEHLDRALAWLTSERAGGRHEFLSCAGSQARRSLAKELRLKIGVDRETARGLVTKLKQMRQV